MQCRGVHVNSISRVSMLGILKSEKYEGVCSMVLHTLKHSRSSRIKCIVRQLGTAVVRLAVSVSLSQLAEPAWPAAAV